MKLIANNSLETQLKIKEVEDKKKSIMDKVAELNLTVEETVEVQRFKIDMDNSEYAKISHLNPSFYKQFSSGMNKLTPAQRELFNLWMDSNNLDSKKSLLLYQDNDICSATDECENKATIGIFGKDYKLFCKDHYQSEIKVFDTYASL